MTQSRLESMARGTQGAELSVKEMETVGVGGCQGRGHSDDMGVTSDCSLSPRLFFIGKGPSTYIQMSQFWTDANRLPQNPLEM